MKVFKISLLLTLVINDVLSAPSKVGELPPSKDNSSWFSGLLGK